MDQNPHAAQQYGPTIIVFQYGKSIKQIVGYVPKQQLISKLAGII